MNISVPHLQSSTVDSSIRKIPFNSPDSLIDSTSRFSQLVAPGESLSNPVLSEKLLRIVPVFLNLPLIINPLKLIYIRVTCKLNM